MQISLSWLSAAVYAVALFCLWHHTADNAEKKPQLRALVISSTVIAAVLHGAALYSNSTSIQEISQSLTGSFSLVTLAATIAFIVISLFTRTITLGLAILPLTILAILANLLLNLDFNEATVLNASLNLHLLVATLTFAVLSVAAAQALIMIIQERRIKQPSALNTNRLSLKAFPPLQSMDSQLFQLLFIGFCLLTISLYLGVTSNIKLHGQALVFSHHIILTLLAWLGFATLLLSRGIWGWRGHKAAKMTLITYVFLVLGYFGTRFVRELILS